MNTISEMKEVVTGIESGELIQIWDDESNMWTTQSYPTEIIVPNFQKYMYRVKPNIQIKYIPILLCDDGIKRMGVMAYDKESSALRASKKVVDVIKVEYEPE
jgi:hypothetical protein